MSGETSLIMIIIGAALVNNVVLSQFLGICSFLGVSSQVKTSASLGGAVIFVMTMIVEMFLKKTSPGLYQALGIFLPLITTNCAVLGVALNNVTDGYNFIESVVSGFGTAVGYTIAIVLLAGIRENIDESDLPAPVKGAPIVLFCAALMGIAFFGFSSLS